MVLPKSSRGSIAMGASKYASPQRKKEHAAFLAAQANAISASTIPDAVSTTGSALSLTVRQEQPPVTAETKLSPGLQVAMEQGMVLKQEVDEHTAKLFKSTSTAAATRQILMALRDSLKSEDSETAAEKLQAVETLWVELEKLYASIQEARSALPGFLEKQNNAASLVIGTVANSAFRGVHDELKVQHQKVDLQHSLIVEQERAFEDAQARLKSQLQEQSETHRAEVTALRDSISCTALTNGCLRQDLDAKTKEVALQDLEYKKKIARGQKKVDALAAELKHIQDKYNHQSVEYGKAFAATNEYKKATEDLRKQIGGLQDTAKTAADVNNKQKAENSALQASNTELQKQLTEAKTLTDKLKGEVDILKASQDGLSRQLLEAKTAAKNDDLGASMEPADTQKEIASLKEQLASATQLGINAYNRYKSIEPTYKKADEYRLENEKLKAGGASIAATEVAFWKKKYNQVLAEKLEG